MTTGQSILRGARTGELHIHKCETCQAQVPCRATECPYPEWTECADCRAGWEIARFEGDIVKRRLRPAGAE